VIQGLPRAIHPDGPVIQVRHPAIRQDANLLQEPHRVSHPGDPVIQTHQVTRLVAFRRPAILLAEPAIQATRPGAWALLPHLRIHRRQNRHVGRHFPDVQAIQDQYQAIRQGEILRAHLDGLALQAIRPVGLVIRVHRAGQVIRGHFPIAIR
jgi:hypothetical protein